MMLDSPLPTDAVAYADWGKWPTLTNEQLLEFAHLVTPHVKWLAPEVVWSIADYNNAHRTLWRAQLIAAGIERPDSYLWAHSPCALPGVRRHGHPDGNPFSKAKTTGACYTREEALCTDDNAFPKLIWHWAQWGGNQGRKQTSGYHLAHLFDHTDYNGKRHGKATAADPWLAGDYWQRQVPYGFAGLYTSAANYCYIPAALLGPTDHNAPLKRLLLQRAVWLYDRPGRCALFPHGLQERLSAPATTASPWQHENFAWDLRYTGNTSPSGLQQLNTQRAACLAKLLTNRCHHKGLPAPTLLG